MAVSQSCKSVFLSPPDTVPPTAKTIEVSKWLSISSSSVCDLFVGMFTPIKCEGIKKMANPSAFEGARENKAGTYPNRSLNRHRYYNLFEI